MKQTFLAGILFFSTLLTFSQQAAPPHQKPVNLDHGLAIKGFDPVAYFTQREGMKGDKKWSASVHEVTYYFSSEQNRDLFKKDPSKYEPQYGGFCAYAMGKDGTKVDIDPETFKIIDGRLFLFYNRFFNNTLKSWDKDEAGLHKNADANWAKISQ